jgi:hypothetical protein
LSGGLTSLMLFFYKWIITNLALKSFLWGYFYWSFIGFWATISCGLLVVAYFFVRKNIINKIENIINKIENIINKIENIINKISFNYHRRSPRPVMEAIDFGLLSFLIISFIYYSIVSSSIPFPVINSSDFWAWISTFTLWSLSGLCMIVGVVIGISLVWSIYEIFFNSYGLRKSGVIAENWTRKNHKTEWFISLYIWVCTILGISTGIGAFIGFNTYLFTASILSAVSLTGLSIYPPLRLKYLKSQYRQQESQKLIEP